MFATRVGKKKKRGYSCLPSFQRDSGIKEDFSSLFENANAVMEIEEGKKELPLHSLKENYIFFSFQIVWRSDNSWKMSALIFSQKKIISVLLTLHKISFHILFFFLAWKGKLCVTETKITDFGKV